MRHLRHSLFALLALMGLALRVEAQDAPDSVVRTLKASNPSLANISQLKVYVNARTVSVMTVRLEGVLTWADASGQSFVLQDESGALRFAFQRPQPPLASGRQARLEGQVALGNGHAVLRQILFLDNDGLHQMGEKSVRQFLKPGKYSFCLDYFQGGRDDGLEVFYDGPNLSRQTIPTGAFSHLDGGSNWSPGLQVDYYEGDWSQLPDFGRLTPVRTGITTNLTLVEPNRGTNFGLRFIGAITIRSAGQYCFYVASDDGSCFSFDDHPWRLTDLGRAELPPAQRIVPGQPLGPGQNYRWSEVRGIVRFAGLSDGSCRLDLNSGEDHMQVDVVSADQRLLALLPDAHVSIQGACEATRDEPDGDIARYLLVPDFNQLVIDRLPLKTWQSYPSNSIASLGHVTQSSDVVHLIGVVHAMEPGKAFMLQDGTGAIQVETASMTPVANGSPVEVLGWLINNNSTNPVLQAVALQSPGGITDAVSRVIPIEQIRFMSPTDLQRGIVVKIRGVVTAVERPSELSVNDGEYGISCWFDDPIMALNPGAFVEVEGTVWPGAFGPDLGHARVKQLGRASLPQPQKPVWNLLINGSLEHQWVEIEGVVQNIQDQTLTVEMSGGRIQAHLASGSPEGLASLQDAIVRVRGTLMPLYNSQRQILGVRLWVNSPLDIDVEEPSRPDPFSVPLKSVAQLSRFDPSGANPFYRVKVQGQILYSGEGEGYLADGSNGLAFLPKAGQGMAAGDYAVVTGFPELDGPVPLLREALVNINGHGALPVPRAATLEEMLAGGCDATRVSVVGALVNYAANPQGVNLEIQVGPRMFMARLAVGDYKLQDIPPGSRIQVTGTCVGQGWRGRGAGFESAELLMNSAADVQILQLPPWWNARRIVALLVVLITVLLLSLTWVYQLRRKVDQRTAQLNQEMRQRKEIELKHAAEQERSRIARDLHDDLGSSLTEISLLASVSLPSVASPENGQPTERFGVIAGKARLLVNSLDVIVWAADPEEDEIQSFVDYLSGFAREFLMASGLACRFKIPIEFPPLTVDGRIRHGLLLAVKETLNNVVRHAQASEVEFGLNVVGNQIEISIEDDGRGFDVATVMRGNGLNNLQERLAGLGGTCEIASRSGAGTTVKILLPIQSAT